MGATPRLAGASRLLPGLEQARSYQPAWLRWDLLAGVTVAAYLVPQCMAYGVLAGLDPVVGLWAALPSLALYALFGSSPQLSVGPESTVAIMTAIALAPLAAGDPGRYAGLAAALAVLVGVLSVIGWALRLGFLADLFSAPILVGYMAGIAVVMVVGQLGKVTGVPVSGHSVREELTSFFSNLDQVEWGVLLLSVVTLTFLLVVAWRWPRLPGPLLAVLLAIALTAIFDLEARGVTVVGALPAGLPGPEVPPLGDYLGLLIPAAGVLLVGYTDNALTGRAFAVRRGNAIDADQEFLALGAANLGAGLLQGFPVSSSGSRTAIGEAAGSRTQLHSLVTVVCVVAVLLFLGSALESFPMAALGAIVIYAATRLVDVGEFVRLARFRRSELVLALATLTAVLVLGVLKGILVAVAVSAAEMLRRIARPHDAVQGRVPGVPGLHDVDDYPAATVTRGLLVYRYDAPLFFANARDFKQRALAAAGERGAQLRWFVLNVEAVIELDITALDAVEEVRAELSGRGVVFALARVKQDVLALLSAYGIADRIGADRLFPTLPAAEDAYRAWEGSAPDH
ncbi:sulfate permease [Nocardioides guangzhouensis]|uniref:Sulfate permease n=1 Tax=Nocardioides guangzhouensis TaxID=2497878 RepID=A0A4Q4Z5F4_9ACTN|nr:sulfate permease [Nocardioides guangzhouensis]